MNTHNTEKLLEELHAAGVRCSGCNSRGGVVYAPEADASDWARAAEVVAAHDPTPTRDQRVARTPLLALEMRALVMRVAPCWYTMSDEERAAVSALLETASERILAAWRGSA